MIKHKIDVAHGREPVTVGESDVDLPSHSLNRTLNMLEKAEIVRLERHPGRLARIWLVDKPGSRAPSRRSGGAEVAKLEG